MEIGTGVLQASSNGKVWGFTRHGTSPSGIFVYKLIGNQFSSRYSHDSSGWVTPSPDGTIIYTSRGAYSSEFVGDIDNARRVSQTVATFPAVQGNLYLSIPNLGSSSREQKASVNLHVQGSSDVIARLPNQVAIPSVFNRSRYGSTWDQRIILAPISGALAVVNDQSVDVYPFDLEQILKEGGTDYLVVVSQAVQTASPGDNYVYPIRVLSKAGRVRFNLDAGPDGMKIDSKRCSSLEADNAGRRRGGRHNYCL